MTQPAPEVTRAKENKEDKEMKSFEGLKDGTIIHNDIDGDMIVRYSDWFSETNEKEICFETERCLWRGTEFDPKDWEVKA